jgi:hypothetical protein
LVTVGGAAVVLGSQFHLFETLSFGWVGYAPLDRAYRFPPSSSEPFPHIGYATYVVATVVALGLVVTVCGAALHEGDAARRRTSWIALSFATASLLYEGYLYLWLVTNGEPWNTLDHLGPGFFVVVAGSILAVVGSAMSVLARPSQSMNASAPAS